MVEVALEGVDLELGEPARGAGEESAVGDDLVQEERVGAVEGCEVDLPAGELVFDAEALVTPTPDDPETEVITGIVSNAPDVVFTTVNPTNLAVIMGGAAQSGFQGQWTGNVPSYDFRLLDSPVAPIIDAAYVQPGYNVAWGTDVPGMAPLRDAMLESRPDLRPSDAFVVGWIEAQITHEVLQRAADSGDMTRAGIKE